MMKKKLFGLLLVMGLSCFAVDEIVEITAPAEFIDFEALEIAIDAWKQEVDTTLNEQEVSLVIHFIQLGSLFSLIDLQARRAVRAIMPLVAQLHDEIGAGRKGLPLLCQIEKSSQDFHQLIVRHDMVLKEWIDWTNALYVSENKRVLNILEKVHERIRKVVEDCIGANEWQQIAVYFPDSFDEQVKTGNLLRSLCILKAEENEDAGDAEADETTVLFSWLIQAAHLYEERSLDTLDAIDQLMRYQDELLTISGVIYNKYLRVLTHNDAQQEIFNLA